MTENLELSINSAALENVSIPADVRNDIWNLVEALTENYEGKRLKTIDKTTDSVTAFFGGPSMGQSSWARTCVEILNSATGEKLVEENESDLQALRRLFLDDESRWMVLILEVLLQDWGRDHQANVNAILDEKNALIRFANGKAELFER